MTYNVRASSRLRTCWSTRLRSAMRTEVVGVIEGTADVDEALTAADLDATSSNGGFMGPFLSLGTRGRLAAPL
jgi:hypothetical protein